MNIFILVNVILIIFFIHVILKIVNKKMYNPSYMFFEKKMKTRTPPTVEQTMDFLLNIDNSNNVDRCNKDPKFDDHIDVCIPNYPSTRPEGAPSSNPLAGNYYVDDKNTANFKSNVINVNKFYRNNFNGLSENELKVIAYDNSRFDNINCPIEGQGQRQEQGQEQGQGPFFSNMNQVQERVVDIDAKCFPNVNVLKEPLPTMWNYKNELPMNGGQIFGNVVGFDTLNDGFTSYSNISDESGCNDENLNCFKEMDDIRFGLGIPNAEVRNNN